MVAIRSFVGVLLLCSGALLPQDANAQAEYPTRPIRFIVPFTPGGISDTLVRVVTDPLRSALGQQVVMDFRPGAGGRLGLEIASKSAADGYTIFLGAQGTLAVLPSLHRKLPYDTEKDFAPVVLLVRSRYLLLMNPGVPANSLKELLGLIRSKPGQFSYASVGAGSTGHFAGEMLKKVAQVNILHIPYKGETPALTGLIGGETQLMFSLPVAPAGHIKAGRIKPLAIAAPHRSPLFPEVPTFEESGVHDFEVATWFGVMTRAGAPAAIVSRLNDELNRILRMEDVRAKLTTLGLEPAGSSVREFGEYIRNERAKWSKVIKDAGITAD